MHQSWIAVEHMKADGFYIKEDYWMDIKDRDKVYGLVRALMVLGIL